MIITNGHNDVHFLPSRTVQLGSGEFSSSLGSPQTLFLLVFELCICAHILCVCVCVCVCVLDRVKERLHCCVYPVKKHALLLGVH